MRHIPALDGVRGVSIAIVLLSHCGLEGVVPGAFGVTLFFFVSGYLITRQLLHGLAVSGRIGLGGFYLRRALRLLPAGLLYIAVAGTMFAVAGGRITLVGWLCAIAYGANAYDVWAGYGSTLAGVRHPFNILWSLAIEEHFYLVWPVVLGFLWRRRIALGAALALCAAALLWRLSLLGLCPDSAGPAVCGLPQPAGPWQDKRLYIGTDTRFDSILWGAVLACAEDSVGRWIERLRRSRLAILAALAMLVGAFVGHSPLARDVMRTTLQGAALVALLPACLSQDHVLKRVLESRPAMLAGRLSYSLYLWHWGAFAFADWAMPGRPLRLWLVGLPLGLTLAVASYAGVERPMLRLRRRAGSQAAAAVPRWNLTHALAGTDAHAADTARNLLPPGRAFPPPGLHGVG